MSPAVKRSATAARGGKEQYCAVQVGFQVLVMPFDKGTQLLKLMQHAVEAEMQFGSDHKTRWVCKEKTRVEFELIDASQIVMPTTAHSPGGRRPSTTPLLSGDHS